MRAKLSERRVSDSTLDKVSIHPRETRSRKIHTAAEGGKEKKKKKGKRWERGCGAEERRYTPAAIVEWRSVVPYRWGGASAFPFDISAGGSSYFTPAVPRERRRNYDGSVARFLISIAGRYLRDRRGRRGKGERVISMGAHLSDVCA